MGDFSGVAVSKIEQIVEGIKDITTFEYYYIQNECFRGKVNELYKYYLVRKYSDTDKERFLQSSRCLYRFGFSSDT